MKIVYAHDWLNGMRGGEKCLELIIRAFPGGDIHTLFHEPGSVSKQIESRPIHESFLGRSALLRKYYKHLLPLYPAAIDSVRPKECDLIVSTSHCVAKSIRVPRGAKHLSYCFTPMRYGWLFFDEYFGSYPRVIRGLIQLILKYLRYWDRKRSREVTRFVAISHHVRKRIEDFYGRDAAVIYPPVNTAFYTPGESRREDFYLIVSALVPYKRIDLAVGAFNDLGIKLVVIGQGPGIKKLKKTARSNISFLGWQTDEEIRNHFRRCRGLIFPGEEDFGIVPVEAQSCGTPVIAYAKGGALETVIRDTTGVFFEHQDVRSLKEAVLRSRQINWDHKAIRAHAEKFSNDRFVKEISREIRHLMNGKSSELPVAREVPVR